MKLKHLRKKIAALLAATIVTSATAQADVSVIRVGQENPMATVGKSTLYGAGTGILAGAAIAAAAGGNAGETVRWSFVARTSAGFLWGIHHVNTRPEPSSAMFSLKSDGSATVALPKPRLRLNEDGALGLDMTLISLAF